MESFNYLIMELEPNYTFVPLASKNYFGLNDVITQEFLAKWGIKGNLVVQKFSFNEPFQPYHKYHLAEAFFKDEVVANELFTKQGNRLVKQGKIASSVDIKQVSCTALSMSFFNKLKEPENGIVHNTGNICKRYDLDIDGFLISDNLRGMLMDTESEEYHLFTKDEREEFIFRIFQILVIGGVLCQYEDTLDPYLEVARRIYKDLIRVQKQEHSEGLSVSTLVFEVVAKDYNNEAYFPYEPSNKQNVGFLLVDGSMREITTVLHQFGEYCLSE